MVVDKQNEETLISRTDCIPKFWLKCTECDYFGDAWTQDEEGLAVCPKCGAKHKIRNSKKIVLFGPG